MQVTPQSILAAPLPPITLQAHRFLHQHLLSAVTSPQPRSPSSPHHTAPTASCTSIRLAHRTSLSNGGAAGISDEAAPLEEGGGSIRGLKEGFDDGQAMWRGEAV